MDILAFASFAVLVLAWVVAPTRSAISAAAPADVETKAA